MLAHLKMVQICIKEVRKFNCTHDQENVWFKPLPSPLLLVHATCLCITDVPPVWLHISSSPMLTKHQLTGFLLRSMRASLFLALLGLFCLLAIAASRDEESPKEKETDRSLKPVRVAHGKAETVKTWSARSADRKSSRTKEGKKKGALKKKKRTFGRKTSKRAGTRKQKLANNPNLWPGFPYNWLGVRYTWLKLPDIWPRLPAICPGWSDIWLGLPDILPGLPDFWPGLPVI